MRKFSILSSILALTVSLSSSLVFSKYNVREIQVKPAKEYSIHQDFQNIVIAARPCETQDKILELFDTKKLYEKGILPVLVVVENNNEFAIRILESDIFFVDEEGTNVSAIPHQEVLLHINLKKPLTAYSTKPELLVQQVTDEKMFMDFEHKAFGEKLIGPGGSDYGVVFFWLPPLGELTGTRIYIPEIFNLTDGEQLMFFEFDLGTTEP